MRGWRRVFIFSNSFGYLFNWSCFRSTDYLVAKIAVCHFNSIAVLPLLLTHHQESSSSSLWLLALNNKRSSIIQHTLIGRNKNNTVSTFAVAIFEPLEFPLKSWSPLAKTASTFTITVSLSNQSAHVLPAIVVIQLVSTECVLDPSTHSQPRTEVALQSRSYNVWPSAEEPNQKATNKRPNWILLIDGGEALASVSSVQRLTVSLGKPLKWSPCVLSSGGIVVVSRDSYLLI